MLSAKGILTDLESFQLVMGLQMGLAPNTAISNMCAGLCDEKTAKVHQVIAFWSSTLKSLCRPCVFLAASPNCQRLLRPIYLPCRPAFSLSVSLLPVKCFKLRLVYPRIGFHLSYQVLLLYFYMHHRFLYLQGKRSRNIFFLDFRLLAVQSNRPRCQIVNKILNI